jgi:hypothetical protein
MFDDTTNQDWFRGIVDFEELGLLESWVWYMSKMLLEDKADPGGEE